MLSSIEAVPIYSTKGSFSSISSLALVSHLFNDGHSYRHDMIPH